MFIPRKAENKNLNEYFFKNEILEKKLYTFNFDNIFFVSILLTPMRSITQTYLAMLTYTNR